MYNEPSHLTAAEWKIRKQIKQMNDEKYFFYIFGYVHVSCHMYHKISR